MKIFIVDDDDNIVGILEQIIIDKDLGEVIGTAENGLIATERIRNLNPDVVLVDLLMPEIDGINLVKDIKKDEPNIQFIMISQVTSKDMVSKAYNVGIEYFITKPIDAIEVQTVIKKVIEKIEMLEKLDQIQSLFNGGGKKVAGNVEDSTAGIKRVMQRIGITGEAGSQDIIDIVKYLMDTNQNMSDLTVQEVCSNFTEHPKSMEQRIRRTATTGMINLANLGIEDYMNEVFTEYSNALYSFEQVRAEMDYIRGNSHKGGKVNIKKFLEGMLYYAELF